MEKNEQEETTDIFEECNNMETIKDENEESLHDLNFQALSATTDEELQDFNNYQSKTNNNHHVVPVGVIICLVTIYLGMTSVQKCLVSCVENTLMTEPELQHKDDILSYLQKAEKLDNSQILERLLEYKDICKDLEVFTKDIKPNDEEKDEEDVDENHYNEDNANEVLKVIEVSGVGDVAGREEEERMRRAVVKVVVVPVVVVTVLSPHAVNLKSKYSIKTTNSKNGFNKYNKSTKAKYQKNHKKELNLNKKNSTAEPIIYLFALVFIYLLLKAASDINQHYKSQNKNDKRLRRCSLQSYAQTHRPDRRASKELALKQKQQLQQQQTQRLKTLSRSSSQEQQSYHYTHHHHQQQQHLMDASPQKTEQHVIQCTGSPVRPKVYYSSNWQLLRQHTTTQSVDNSDLLIGAHVCSVPAALSYQRQKLSTNVSPLSIVNDHVNVSLSRRTSITSSLPLATMDPTDSLAPETKRRVRMINRH
ncbi:LOW QUALITY PROTEIN: uncharacterized protein LOC119605108 [Lucilia sericata]|uniref:LOW QUALITY PROTEIN: uncharacterized protein LOC119605108 n=1 Tax=Lucilia sericata TaxID=13632 RepID=UPI0018A87490|nr:LOW QUALITY PROTEIN: uncharacterized protein LOC119605108 [Lucilia sericata]